MNPHVDAWLLSAEADLRAARTLRDGGHALHAVFTCHLAVEKALKALVQVHTSALPPKSHNLAVLAALAGVEIPVEWRATVAALSGVSAVVRYFLDMEEANRQYPAERIAKFIDDAEGILTWARSFLL